MVADARTMPACERAADGLLEAGQATHGLDDRQVAILGDLYRAADLFFDQPDEDRRAATLPCGCGFVPFGQEHSGDPGQPDQVDFFVYSPRVRHMADDLAGPPARALLAAMMTAFDEFEAIAEAIAGRVAERVGGRGASGRLGGGLRRWSLLEVHRARPLAQGALINQPHEDGVLLTLAHADAPGLEIEVDGAFVPAVRPPGAVTVMPGSALTLLTGGAVQPLRHRVRAGSPGRPRLSLLFFADLDPGRCAPWRVTGVNEGVDIGAHVAGNAMRFGVAGLGTE